MKRIFIIRIIFVLLFGLITCSVQAAAIQLTQEEQAWLKDHPIIRISGPQAFPPFQYVDDQGVFTGMASDYIFHIAKLVGLQVEVAENQPWPEILKKIERKDIDVLTCAAITAERQNYLIFTKPHLSFPLVIISRKDAPFISGLPSLHKKRIAVTHKVSTYEWLQRDKINAIPHFVNSPLEALKAVSLGTADVTIQNLAAATYLIEKNGLANLKIAAPTSYENYTLSIAVRQDWPELASILDKGLAAMSPNQHNEIRRAWIGVRYEYGISTIDIVKWLLLVGGIAGIFLTVFYCWNRKLSQEIKERKKAESEKENLIVELKGALDEIKTLRGILPICSECKKIRDNEGDWTQIEAYITRHSEADFSHGMCPDCSEKLYGKERWYKQVFSNMKDDQPKH